MGTDFPAQSGSDHVLTCGKEHPSLSQRQDLEISKTGTDAAENPLGIRSEPSKDWRIAAECWAGMASFQEALLAIGTECPGVQGAVPEDQILDWCMAHGVDS